MAVTPDSGHVVSAIEAKAKRLGLSRTEYLRRQMLRIAATSGLRLCPTC